MNQHENKKWKSRLASSSLPLEYEVARLLVSHGFGVAGEYSYTRMSSGEEKTFSVDVDGLAFSPFTNPHRVTGSLELLVECKYRRPEKKWLFIRDPNKPDYSPILLGATLRVLDAFSPYAVKGQAAADFERQLDFCYKGTEVNTKDGSVCDSDISKGISQLQFALPRLVSLAATDSLLGHIDDAHVKVFCPVLVTTAKLYVAKRNFSTSAVVSSSSMDDLARHVPYLIMYRDCPADFTMHCTRECAQLRDLLDRDETKRIENARKRHSISVLNSPEWMLSSLINGGRFCAGELFRQFVVCEMKHLPTLVSEIKRATTRVLRTRKMLI